MLQKPSATNHQGEQQRVGNGRSRQQIEGAIFAAGGLHGEMMLMCSGVLQKPKTVAKQGKGKGKGSKAAGAALEAAPAAPGITGKAQLMFLKLSKRHLDLCTVKKLLRKLPQLILGTQVESRVVHDMLARSSE